MLAAQVGLSGSTRIGAGVRMGGQAGTGGHQHIGDGATGLAGGALAYATPSQTNLDRNTVDMDRERAAFADNSVKYEATLRFINGSMRTMLDAIKGQ